MDAKNKLILMMLVTSMMGLLFQTPIMTAVGDGMHTFINGRNVDCISCHGYGSANSHQAGSDAHQMAAENKNYTTYLEVGGTSYDPAGIIYTNIDSDSSGSNDVWIWSGNSWIYDNKEKLYNLDFNGDGSIGGSETCNLCHNRELMRVSAQMGPEHSFGPRYCNDARCHGNSNEDFRFFKNGYDTIPPATISNPGITTGNFYINNTWTNPSDPDFNFTLFKDSNGTNITTINFSINYFNRTLSPHYVQNISAQTLDIYGNINLIKIWFNVTIPNNPPILAPIGNKNVVPGSILQFNITAIDADNDTLAYGTNATKGSLNATTGIYSWETVANDTGEYVWNFGSIDDYGGIASETIMIKVSPAEQFIPPIPANLTATQGNFWINYTWEPGAGNITDSYNLSLNGNYTNGTTFTYHNDTVGPHGWSNITVWAYNNTGGMNSISMETQVLNNQPVLESIGNKNVTAGSLLRFNVTAMDADNDTLSYGTNASNGILNQSTGEYSWNTSVLNIGTYIWYFDSSDNYSGLASETINVTVIPEPVYEYIPPDPVNLSSTQDNFWINHSWEPGTGNNTDSYNVSLNGIWINGTIDTYYNTSVPPHGWNNITLFAYNISGNGSLSSSPVFIDTQLANNLPVQTPIGDRNITAGNVLTFNFSADDIDFDLITYGTNASRGLFNQTTGEYSWSTNSSDVGTYTWYFDSNDGFGGNDTETIIVTVSPQQNYIPPAPLNLSAAQGNFWIEYTWEPGTGNISDSYNFTVNGNSYTTVLPYRNDTVGPHNWSNISIWSYNSSGTGSLNTSSIWLNTQVSNNIPVQDPISSTNATIGEPLIITVHANDSDFDTITYSTNATSGSINSSTGVYTWTPGPGDEGTYLWSFNSSDNYGGVDKQTITITVSAQPVIESIPPVPANLTVTQSNFWVNYTWQAGSGNVTDSYNVSHNSLWTNASTLAYMDNFVGAHGWSNITVYAYNNSGSLSLMPASMDTLVANSVPVQDPIGSQSITIGEPLIITVHANDSDFDTITYSTNATSGSINSSTGVYTWTPGTGDEGTYQWSFNSSDNYGGVDKQTITITVSAQPVIESIPPVPVNLTVTQSNFWVNYTWQAGSGNVTDSYNVSHNNLWTNGSTLAYMDNFAGAHGWSNITVYAYNNSGSLSLMPASMDTLVANSVPVQDPIGSQSITIGEPLIITVHANDSDFDTITYSTNATNGSINSSTGVYTWTPLPGDEGTYLWSFNSSDNYGGVDKQTITITVSAQPVSEYIPPVPVSLTATQDNFWIRYTWAPGMGNVTDSYNLTVNGVLSTTSLTSRNDTVEPHGWSNITVWAYNNSGGQSQNSVSLSTQVQNNQPVINIGNKNVVEGELLQFQVTANDADSDTLTFGTDASKGSLDPDTGIYSWQTVIGDAGTYIWNFSTMDNYGGVDTKTITVTVNPSSLPVPPTPENLAFTRGNFWIRYTWAPGMGNVTDSYNLTVNGVLSTTSLTSRNDTVEPHGWSNITVWAYNNSGGQSQNSVSLSTQVQNNQPVINIGNKNVVEGELLQFQVTANDADSDTLTFGTDASKGSLDPNTGIYSWQTVIGDVGIFTWNFSTMDNYGGVDTKTITVTVNPSSLPVPPTPENLAFTRGNFWIRYTWAPGTGNVTDSYNLTVNGVSSTTSLISRNDTVEPHGWSNITVRAYNNSGGQSLDSVSLSTQVQNNQPVINIGNKNVVEGELLQFQVTSNDADSDTLTFGTNASKGSLNPDTGIYSWQTVIGDVGIFTWNFSTMDNYGGVDTKTITVTVNPSSLPVPPAPVSLDSTQGNFWIRYTWAPGTGSVTDSYNLTVNGVSSTTSLTSRNDTVGPHGWSNITVWAYNNSGGQSQNSVSLSTQVQNNQPVQSAIGNRNIIEGDTLQFTVSSTDADSDPLAYLTNATQGNLNSGTGSYSWSTSVGDAGVYTWYFRSIDGYGGIDTETITITVNPSSLPVPPAPVSLDSTQGNFWIRYTWAPGTGNVTDSYNLTVNGVPSTTSLTSHNDTVGPHGWSNITVRAYNNSGGQSQNSVYLSTQVQNNNPVQSAIGNRNVLEGDTLQFTVSSTDADSDPLAYLTNATQGNLNSGTGSYSWSTSVGDAGVYTWYFRSIDGYGGIDTETITITVNPSSLPVPPAPVSLDSTQDNFWIRYTWSPGTGNVTDSYNLTVNGVPSTTSLTSRNDTVGPHGWSNITVRAYNNSGGQSVSSVSLSTQVQNNNPVQAAIGNRNVLEGETLQFTVSSTDADSDPLAYLTNATQGNLNSGTGSYSWSTSVGDAGVYTWYFRSIDGYGGIDTETITITVNPSSLPVPPAPVSLDSTQDNFWIRYTWSPGTGNVTDSYNLTVNGVPSTTSLTSRNDTVGPHGWSNITVRAYNNSGGQSQNSVSLSTQVQNNNPVQSSIGNKNIIEGDLLQFTVTANDADSDTLTFGTDASKGSLNSGSGSYSWQTAIGDAGVYTWYFNTMDNYGGVDTETITITVDTAPLPVPPAPVNLGVTQGNFWIEYSWEPGIGSITDSYNLNVNGAPYTTSLTTRSDTVGPHGWSNITVWAYNNSGGQSVSSVSRSTQVQNNNPVQSSIGNKNIIEGDLLEFTVTANDADSDTLTFGTDASKGSLNSGSGSYSWQTAIGDAGVYTWYFNTMDNYGGVDTETITITVDTAPLPVPPAPVNLGVTQGNFWIEYSWEPGIGSITDSYNLNVNGAPYTTSLTTRSDTVGPHGWSNITVRAYNNSGGQSVSSVSRSTQVQNNNPVQSSIGNKNIIEGDLLEFTVTANDADSDTLTFGTDASKGSLNSGSGSYSWQTAIGDAGVYTWYFNTMDNYGGVDTETITVTVSAAGQSSQTITLAANSAENTGFLARTTGENLYSTTISNAQVDSRTTLTGANLNALSVDDTSYVARTGTNTRDVIMVVNFTLSNVQNVNWISLKFVGAVTSNSEPIAIGLYNQTSPSGGGWTRLNSTTPSVGTYSTITYNMTSQADKDKYLVLNGNTLTFSFAEWVNGPSNAGLSNDLYEATVNYT